MQNFIQKISVTFFLSILFCLLFAHSASARNQKQVLQVGDLIFHKSVSDQSKALTEATESEWTHVGLLAQYQNQWFVAEAIGPVKMTPLNEFIRRGKNNEFRIYRFKHFNPQTMTQKLYSAIQKLNKPYDIFFEFSNERTYCSELVYKAMLQVTGHEVGTIQKMKDMRLDGPYVKELIAQRLTETGRELNPEEPIITPISQMNEKDLILIRTHAGPVL